MRRIVVTGIGTLSALGTSTRALLDSLRAARSGTARVTAYDPSSFNCQVGAELDGLSFESVATGSELRQLDRQTLLALTAAAEATAQAGFSSAADPHRCGVVLGTGMGPSETIEDGVHTVLVEGRSPRPTTVPKMMYNAPAGHLSIRHGCQGPSLMIVTACSASAHALAQAALMIRTGLMEACLAGGTEPFPARTLFAAWDALRVMSCDNEQPERASRPFSRDRQGFVIGEGAAVLVLEAEERARARNAAILGELAGFGMSSDAVHITRPQQAGFVAALRAALADAHLDPADVDYINAHGTATAANDPLECAAIRECFGPCADQLAVSSTKSAHGHTIGAAGALEAAVTLLAMAEGFAPATLHLSDPDPACDLDLVPCEPRAQKVQTALTNSFAFGGHNVVLALRRFDG